MQHNDKAQPHRAEQDRSNRGSNEENAEGSRGTVNTDVARAQEERDTGRMNGGSELTEEAVGQPDDQGGGISNRPRSEEQGRQENVPPRGERRENRRED